MSFFEELKERLSGGGWMIVSFFIGLALTAVFLVLSISSDLSMDFVFLSALLCAPLVFTFLIFLLHQALELLIPIYSEAPVICSIILIVILLFIYKPFKDPKEDAQYIVNTNTHIIHKIDDCEYLPAEENSEYYKSLDSAINDDNTLCDYCLEHLIR